MEHLSMKRGKTKKRINHRVNSSVVHPVSCPANIYELIPKFFTVLYFTPFQNSAFFPIVRDVLNLWEKTRFPESLKKLNGVCSDHILLLTQIELLSFFVDSNLSKFWTTSRVCRFYWTNSIQLIGKDSSSLFYEP